MKNTEISQNWYSYVGFMGEKENGYICSEGKNVVVTDYVELRIDPKKGSPLYSVIEYTEEDWIKEHPDATPFIENDGKHHGDYHEKGCPWTMKESVDRIVAYVHFTHETNEFNTIFFEVGSVENRVSVELKSYLTEEELREIIDFAENCMRNDFLKLTQNAQWDYAEDAEELGVVDVKENSVRKWKGGLKSSEMAKMIDNLLLDVWSNYQASRGITEGDICPEDSLSYDALLKQVAETIMTVSNNNLPTFLDDEEKMADFERLSKEEFLSMYSYLSEEEYDHTKEMKEFFYDEDKPVIAITGKGQYYALTASMLFEKTVLVPCDKASSLDEAIDIVDKAVELCDIDLLGQDADYRIASSSYADENGIYILSDDDALTYQILCNDIPHKDYDFDEICPHCDHVNKVKWDRKNHSIICEGCGKKILLCNLCNMDNCECGKCPYEKELEIQQKEGNKES